MVVYNVETNELGYLVYDNKLVRISEDRFFKAYLDYRWVIIGLL